MSLGFDRSRSCRNGPGRERLEPRVAGDWGFTVSRRRLPPPSRRLAAAEPPPAPPPPPPKRAGIWLGIPFFSSLLTRNTFFFERFGFDRFRSIEATRITRQWKAKTGCAIMEQDSLPTFSKLHSLPFSSCMLFGNKILRWFGYLSFILNKNGITRNDMILSWIFILIILAERHYYLHISNNLSNLKGKLDENDLINS